MALSSVLGSMPDYREQVSIYIYIFQSCCKLTFQGKFVLFYANPACQAHKNEELSRGFNKKNDITLRI